MSSSTGSKATATRGPKAFMASSSTELRVKELLRKRLDDQSSC